MGLRAVRPRRRDHRLAGVARVRLRFFGFRWLWCDSERCTDLRGGRASFSGELKISVSISCPPRPAALSRRGPRPDIWDRDARVDGAWMESRSRRAARPLDCSLTLCRSTRHEGVFEDWERAKHIPRRPPCCFPQESSETNTSYSAITLQGLRLSCTAAVSYLKQTQSKSTRAKTRARTSSSSTPH